MSIIAFQNLAQPIALGQPLHVIRASALAEVAPAIQAAEQAAKNGMLVVGFVSYEAAPAFDAAMTVGTKSDMPLVWFAVHDPAATQPWRAPSTALAPPLEWAAQTPQAQYDADIATIQQAIAAGDTYQVNYTLRLCAPFIGEARALFERLWRAQPAPYAAFLDAGRFKIASFSPELFFHRKNGMLTTRPMKGTARRGRWLEEDAEHAAWLAASEKDRAENLMIVDLLRNDLGRVAEIGSVHVADLFRVERYPTVWQMTSTVCAAERPGTSLADIFQALFPCGSVTGAPKISTMRLIAQLEQQPRDVYCGAIGVILPGGEALFNVAIRTVVVDTKHQTATYGVGGGITADSTAAGEYAETQAKAAVLREPWPVFALLETMRLKHGRFTFLKTHMQRLEASAAYFGVPFDRGAVQRQLEAVARTQPRLIERVRLLVSQRGEIAIEHGALVPMPPAPRHVVFASAPVSRYNRFLFHKTTNRAVYETARAQHGTAFDVLLWNEDGELTEFTNGNLVLERDGMRYTPPRSSGLLNGVLRDVLLRRGSIKERVLYREDAHQATRIWFLNSVRGWLEVVLGDDESMGE